MAIEDFEPEDFTEIEVGMQEETYSHSYIIDKLQCILESNSDLYLDELEAIEDAIKVIKSLC